MDFACVGKIDDYGSLVDTTPCFVGDRKNWSLTRPGRSELSSLPCAIEISIMRLSRAKRKVLR